MKITFTNFELSAVSDEETEKEIEGSPSKISVSYHGGRLYIYADEKEVFVEMGAGNAFSVDFDLK